MCSLRCRGLPQGDELINRKIIDFNNIITLHNVEYHNFDSVKATASKEKLKEHYLSVEQTTYSTYYAEEKDAETKVRPTQD